MLAERFTLIPAPAAPQDSVSRFLELADGIARTEKVCVLVALQRAVDRHPAEFERYVEAIGSTPLE